MDIYAELYDGLKEKMKVSRKNSQVAKIVRKEWLCKAKRCCPAILATICLTISYVYLSAFFSFRMAFSGFFFFFKQSDKAATDDSSGSMFASCLKSSFVGDTETYH